MIRRPANDGLAGPGDHAVGAVSLCLVAVTFPRSGQVKTTDIAKSELLYY